MLRKTLAAKGLDGKPNIEVINDKVLQLARMGERWAVELIYDRIEGKPAQALEISGDQRRPLRIWYVLPKEPT